MNMKNNNTKTDITKRRIITMNKLFAFVISAAAAVCCMTACSSSGEVDPEEFGEKSLEMVNLSAKAAYTNAQAYIQDAIADGRLMEVPRESTTFSVGEGGAFARAASVKLPKGSVYIGIAPDSLKVECVQFTSPYSEYVGQYPDPNEDTDSDVEWKGTKSLDVSADIINNDK